MLEWLAAHEWLQVAIAMFSATAGIIGADYVIRHWRP